MSVTEGAADGVGGPWDGRGPGGPARMGWGREMRGRDGRGLAGTAGAVGLLWVPLLVLAVAAYQVSAPVGLWLLAAAGASRLASWLMVLVSASDDLERWRRTGGWR